MALSLPSLLVAVEELTVRERSKKMFQIQVVVGGDFCFSLFVYYNL
jgi:hypothetical protein